MGYLPCSSHIPRSARLPGMLIGNLSAPKVDPQSGLGLRLRSSGLLALGLGLSLLKLFLTCLSTNLSSFGPLYNNRTLLSALLPLQSLLTTASNSSLRALLLRSCALNLIAEFFPHLRLRRLNRYCGTSSGLRHLKALVWCPHNFLNGLVNGLFPF